MFKRLITGLIPAFCVTACSTVAPNIIPDEVATITGPVPGVNTTPMEKPLACLKEKTPSLDLRVGVSEFVDGTGTIEGDSNASKTLTQRPDMMMVVAMANAGMRMVNRSSVNVAEWELRNALEKKLGDGRAVTVDNQTVDFRPVKAGMLLGSTHYITGAITELNWNIDSNVIEGGIYGLTAGRRSYRIGLAVDVVVTDSRTTEVVHARSYKKQLVGYELSAGFFRFMETDKGLMGLTGLAKQGVPAVEAFEANLGDKKNEPVQAAVRWIIELSAYDIARSLTKKGKECDELLPAGVLPELKPAPVPASIAVEPAGQPSAPGTKPQDKG